MVQTVGHLVELLGLIGIAAKKHLLLVLESFRLLTHDSISQVIRLIHVGRESYGHQFFSIFCLEVVQVSRMALLLLSMDLGVVAHDRHGEKVSLPEIISEGDSEVKGAISQMVVIVLVLIYGLHERHRIANETRHLV